MEESLRDESREQKETAADLGEREIKKAEEWNRAGTIRHRGKITLDRAQRAQHGTRSGDEGRNGKVTRNNR